MKTNKEIIDEYIKIFGGFPYFLFLSIDDSDDARDPEFIAEVQNAINRGRKIEAEFDDADH